MQILPDGLLTMTRARVFSVHSKQTPKNAFGEKKKSTLKSIRRTCHMTGAESRGSPGRPGLHPAKPELCCASGSPSMSHQSSLLGNEAPSRLGGCLLSPVHPSDLFLFPVLPQPSDLGNREQKLLEFRSGISTSNRRKKPFPHEPAMDVFYWYNHMLILPEPQPSHNSMCSKVVHPTQQLPIKLPPPLGIPSLLI